MTISLSENTPRISYSVNEGASQTAFTVPFEFYAEADLNFYVDGTKKTIATHYTVSGGDGTTGTINTTSGNTVTGISGGSTVVITRSIALARTTDFPASGPFAISTLNTELDKFIAIQADNDDTIDRALHLADDDTAVSMELPLVASRKGTVLGFNASTGAAEVGPTIANVNSLSAITANINTTAGIAANVTTVAGIAANVTTVAGVASNVTTVAGSIADINRLGPADVVADMALLATTDVIADMALLANSDVIADMNTLATSAIVADLNILATTDIVADMALLATSDIVSDLNTLATADIVSDLNVLATSDIVSDINTLATSDIVSDLNTLATSDIVTDLNLLATSAIVEDLSLLATSTVIADMATLAGGGANPNITTLTASGEIAAASLDISGNIDVDGVTNLDVVDIDGAVNMATTALVTGVLTTTAATVFNGGFASNAASTISTADNTDTLQLISTDADANVGPNLRLYRNSSSPADSDTIGVIDFEGRNDNSQDIIAARINVLVDDVSDGTEDATLFINTMLAGSVSSRIKMTPTETVFNDDSKDLDFRVESNGQTHKLFVNGGEDVVCFGFETPETIGGIESGVQIEGTDYAGGSLSIWRNANDDAGGYLQLGKSRGTAVNSDTIVQDNDDVGIINFIGADGTDRAHPIASIRAAVDGTPGNNDMPGRIEFMTTADGGTTLTERARIDNSGNVLVGKTAVEFGDAGTVIFDHGEINITRSGTPLYVRRNGGNGKLVTFYGDATISGHIGTVGNDLFFGSGDTGLRILDSSNAIIPIDTDSENTRDNAIDFGTGSGRFDDIYATNATIQTSDQTEKQDIAALTSTEMLVGKRISALFKTFRWKDKVASKGDNARTHTGIIAQDVQAAFTAEGLDAGDYSLFISSTWLVDSEGNEVAEGTEGAVSKTRMGIRYPELLSFVAAYNEQRFANIETRLTALEG